MSFSNLHDQILEELRSVTVLSNNYRIYFSQWVHLKLKKSTQGNNRDIFIIGKQTLKERFQNF